MLHKIYLLVLGVLVSFSVKAQMQDRNAISGCSSIGISYDDVSIGRNLSIVYRQPLGKGWSIYGGGKYFINSRFLKNNPFVYTPFFKEFYAKEAIGHFGVKLGIEKVFFRSDYCQLFAFSDFQLTAANVENVYRIFDGTAKLDERHNLQLYAYETALGIGMLLPVTPRTTFRLQGGLGANFYRFRDKQPYSLAGTEDGWSFNRTFALGLQYNLKGQAAVVVKKQKRRSGPDEYPENSIRVGYDDIQTGRNLNLTYSYGLAKGFSVYGGIKFNINSGLYYDYTQMEESRYFKQFWATGASQRFGLKAGLEYSYSVPGSTVKLFGFYDLQVLRSDVRNLAALSYFASGVSRSKNVGGSLWGVILGDNPPVSNPPKPMFRIYGPVTALENYVGLGAKFALSNKMNFRIQGGVGYNIYLGPDTYQTYDIDYYFRKEHHENVPWTANKSELSRMFSLGLEYKIFKRDR